MKIGHIPNKASRGRKRGVERSEHRKGRSYGGVEHSKEYDRSMTLQKKAEERRWAELCGPVTVRKVDPSSISSS